MTESDYRALVERARSGNRAAFDELVGTHRSHLAAIINQRLGEKLRIHITVDDVLQETLLRAFRSINRFEWRDDDDGRTNSFFRWLSGIAVRIILELAGKLKKDAPVALDFDLVGTEEISPSRSLARKERLERFEKALESLNPDQQTALRLVRIEGLPLREVASRMDRAPNAVSALILRALRKLRENFGAIGDTESLRLPEDGLEPPQEGEED